MRAMILEHCGAIASGVGPLREAECPTPQPGPGELLIRVNACGVCHTELDVIEGRTPPQFLPMIPGHQVVGAVVKAGVGTVGWSAGERVGVAWIRSACGSCEFCIGGQENLCRDFRATGRDSAGGYAEFMTAPAAFVHRIPDVFEDVCAAPLLCAGAVGYRALRLAGVLDGQHLGFMGFGASAHIVLQLALHRYPRIRLYVFARSAEERKFAQQLGAHWVGDIAEFSPVKLNAVIDTTPAWLPLISALENLERGGRLIINAIRKEEHDKAALLKLDYERHLWMEKEIKTVANVTRADVRELLHEAARIRLVPEVKTYPLEDANAALRELRETHVRGAKVLVVRAGD